MIKNITYLGISIVFAINLQSCLKCEQCYYVLESNGDTTEEPMGEYCGDEIKILEKKEYTDPAGEAHVECR